jgi:hypothetical protein
MLVPSLVIYAVPATKCTAFAGQRRVQQASSMNRLEVA